MIIRANSPSGLFAAFSMIAGAYSMTLSILVACRVKLYRVLFVDHWAVRLIPLNLVQASYTQAFFSSTISRVIPQ